MRWILFWVFVSLFIVVVVVTLMAAFLGLGSLRSDQVDLLVKAFILEIGAAVVALFYSIFGLRQNKGGEQSRVRLTLGKGTDMRQLVGKTATLSLSTASGANLDDDISRMILNDGGPYIPLDLPPTTHDVYVTVTVGGNIYSGSFVVGTHLVDLTKSEA